MGVLAQRWRGSGRSRPTLRAAGMRKHRSFAGGLANGSNRREAEVPARLPSWLGLTQSELCQQPGEGCGTLSAES
jgi:hypothetical protein